MEIKNIYGSVVFTSKADTLRDTVLEAVKSRANLSRANLSRADLSGANLSGADLSGANLSGADLSGTNLSRADLSRANLSRADLSGANLSGTNLSRADLSRANLSGVKDAEFALAQVQFIPETGSFEAWKQCRGGVIVKLLIPEDAKRSHGAGRKCRASKAVVLDILGAEIATSGGGYGQIEYRKGETVEPTNGFDENRWNVCSAGIHFFLTKAEATAYEL